MLLITIVSISTDAKNKKRYFLHLEASNGKKDLVSLSEETIMNYHLKEKQQLSREQLNAIIHHEQINKALQIAVNFLAYRARSVDEVKKQLLKKQKSPDIIEAVIERLCKLNYLNDQEFAQNFINNQITVNNSGPILIENKLREQKINKEIYHNHLENYSYDKQLYHATILAEKFLAKQVTSQIKAKQKTIDYLLRKGHTIDVARAVCEQNLSSHVTVEKEWQALCRDGFLLHNKYKQRDNNTYYSLIKDALIRKGYPFALITHFLNAGKEAIEKQEIESPFY